MGRSHGAVLFLRRGSIAGYVAAPRMDFIRKRAAPNFTFILNALLIFYPLSALLLMQDP